MNASFLNFASQSPIIELHLSVLDEIKKDEDEDNLFFICKSALKSCSINVTNNKLMCAFCINRAENAVKKFQENHKAKTIYITKDDLLKYTSQKNTIEEKHQFNIELGVRSSIASHVRIDQFEKLTNRWRSYYTNMLESSNLLYLYFTDAIKNKTIENIVIFNGRFSCARPIVEASIKTNINYFVFDTIMQKRPVVVKNCMLHNLEIAKKNAISSYLKNFNQAEKIAEEYIYSKMNKIAINDKVYTKNQILKYIPEEVLNSKKPIITFFTSSDDEYRYIGADWKNYPIVSQTESITKLVNSKLQDDYFFIVRMHPNQQFMSKSNTNEYLKLSALTKNLIIIEPDNKTDSYELIKKSQIVVNFCSSIGIEANYLRKPIVQIGPSSFRLLPAANYVNSADDAIKMIESNSYKLMPIRASIIWFTYLSKFEYELSNFKVINNGLWYFENERIKSSYFLRLLAVPSKIYTNILKSNYSFITKFPLYISNLITNKYKV